MDCISAVIWSAYFKNITTNVHICWSSQNFDQKATYTTYSLHQPA